MSTATSWAASRCWAASSTGKSSLAQALAAELGTVQVAEYGRELWEERAGQLDFADLLRIAEEQVRREHEAAGRAREWLVCDTTPLTTLFYSHAMFGCAEPALDALAGRAYDLVVLCEPDFPFVQDGTRRDESFRMRQHRWYEAELARAAGPVHARAWRSDPAHRCGDDKRAACKGARTVTKRPGRARSGLNTPAISCTVRGHVVCT